MEELLQAIGFTKYKCLHAENGSFLFDANSNVSLIIGRNNSGKSSVIDVVEQAFNPHALYDVENLYFSVYLDDQHIRNGFHERTFGGVIGVEHYVYGKKFIGKKLNIIRNNKDYDVSSIQDSAIENLDNWYSVASSYRVDLSNYVFRRVNADRDIMPEPETDNETVEQNGDGATNIIRKYLNYANYDEGIIEHKILDELNKIMGPDASFTGLRVQQIDSSNNDNHKKWEIFLEENGKRFALSKSGSGLKTIILILINLYIIPQMPAYSKRKIVYAFEEVENNLHPALQRRLFNYLYEYSIKEKRRIFLTSHSHVAINTFFGKENVSIYHVTKNNGISSVTKIVNDTTKMNILDDLDVKASDMFQANGIIWVEGPSDRIYIKRWLEVFTPNELNEGVDYQFAYYGGRLLAHYTSEDGIAKDNDLIDVLKINRHAAIIIDSDRRNKGAQINKTKRRIRSEFEESGYFCWITEGKEIENYVSSEAVNMVHNSNLKQIDQFDCFKNYIEDYDSNFDYHKVDSARKYCEFITAENSFGVLNLKEQIQKLYSVIKNW